MPKRRRPSTWFHPPVWRRRPVKRRGEAEGAWRRRPVGRRGEAEGGRTGSRSEREAEDGRHILLPARSRRSPLRQVAVRLSFAGLLLVATAFVVYADRTGYHDNAGGGVDLLDAFYYATVTLSTTGYGDIVPYSDAARLVNILVVTPLRVLFLIILVGTTLEVLAERTRSQLRVSRWRSRMRDHIVVIGYGTKGRNAVLTLLDQGADREHVVVVDPQRQAVDAANHDGLAGILGDGTRSETLRRAGLPLASRVVVTTQRDDTAVLTTLTARQLNPSATIVVAVREDENVPLLRQSGADVVVTSSSSAGRLLGLSVISPYVGAVLEDLLTHGTGLDIVERAVTPAEAGRSPRESPDLVAAVVRGGRLLDFPDPEAASLRPDDRVVAIERADGGPERGEAHGEGGTRRGGDARGEGGTRGADGTRREGGG